GDTEATQTNARKVIPVLPDAKVLMCFFHVLYNVRKRIHHFSREGRQLIMSSATDMHFCEITNE
ncbi:hypothetical protein PHYSODRAFT_488820, partial [Phytophthora sojae]